MHVDAPDGPLAALADLFYSDMTANRNIGFTRLEEDLQLDGN